MDSTTTIALGALAHALQPYIVMTLESVLGIAFTYIVTQGARLIHVQITEAQWQVVHSAADAAAKRIWAAAEPSIATAKIDVRSPSIAIAAQAAIDTIPRIAAATGVTPDNLASLIVAKLGGFQVATAAPAPAVAPAPKAAS